MKTIRFLYNKQIYSGILNGKEVQVNGGGLLEVGDIDLITPVIPSKVVAVGLNYREHALELDMDIPKTPVIFLKPATAVIGPGEDICCPDSVTRLDYEAELGIVIKKRAWNVKEEDAEKYIEGYTCFNDVTARDIQKKDGQWTRAKSFDTFAPVGPCIETEISPDNLRIITYLNGKIKQDSRTSDMIFNVRYLVSFISQVMTLLPGDVIATGTPPGVGEMKHGDEIIVEVEGIGRLCNRVNVVEIPENRGHN